MTGNGQLTRGQLTLIQTDAYLAVKPARAWRRFRAAAKSRLDREIAAAGKAGAYRSIAVQRSIQKAFDSGSPIQKAAWNLDPYSTVRPADPGLSNHGFGTAVDIVGTDIDHALVVLARRYGFTFPFGDRDPRHAVHDGKTATSPFAVPAGRTVTYTVRSGDTLSEIAARYRTTVGHLLTINPGIHDANLIRVGQKVRVS